MNERLIKGLEWILDDDRFGFGQGITKPETDEEIAGCIIRNAIDQLKPVKPIRPGNGSEFWLCGKCSGHVFRISDNYCPNCGRKIDWEENS